MAKSNNSNKKSNNNGGSSLSLNKISLYTLGVAAILYLVAMILKLVDVSSQIVGILQSLASAVMICIVAVNAWRYVKNKPVVWKVLYIIILLVVIVGLIIPLVVNV